MYLVGFIRRVKQACLLACLSQHFLAYRQHYIIIGYCCIYPYWHLSGHNLNSFHEVMFPVTRGPCKG